METLEVRDLVAAVVGAILAFASAWLNKWRNR